MQPGQDALPSRDSGKFPSHIPFHTHSPLLKHARTHARTTSCAEILGVFRVLCFSPSPSSARSPAGQTFQRPLVPSILRSTILCNNTTTTRLQTSPLPLALPLPLPLPPCTHLFLRPSSCAILYLRSRNNAFRAECPLPFSNGGCPITTPILAGPLLVK